MKSLIILALTIASLNAFASDKKVGEDKKGECQFGPQGNRAAKVVSSGASSEQKKVETKTMSK